MIKENLLWTGSTTEGNQPVCIIPKMANRHGLVAGATGTGKTVTLKVLAESFSDMGVPVFMADVKGDVSGIMMPGTDSEDMQNRIARFGLAEAGFQFKGCPVAFWDIYGQTGIPLRTTISEMGPLLLSRVLGLNELQSDILTIIFKIADDNGLLLIDIKDLKSMVNYISENADQFAADYGKISDASLGVITRALVALETEGGNAFFGAPNLQVTDWLAQDNGKGVINILDSSSLINNSKLYSTFLLWLMAELFETMPEVGDLDKPKMVFFFDEAHLLFSDAPKVLLDKIEQMVKLIRSKGVGVYFCTQNPKDIPDGVLSQLGNKIQHGLRAYTPADQRGARAAADSFRENPAFDTYQTILELGTGEAVVSFLGEDGIPTVAEKVSILPPQCAMSAAPDINKETAVKGSILYSKYAQAIDPDSAYERLAAQATLIQAEREEAEAAAAAAKEAEKAEKEAAREAEKAEKEAAKAAEKAEREAAKAAEKAEREAERERKKKIKNIASVSNSVAGTVGREIGKTIGGKSGKFGKTLGGNLGASLARGIMNTLLKR